MREEHINMDELDGKWEGLEEVNNPRLLMVVPCLVGDLSDLLRLTIYGVPP